MRRASSQVDNPGVLELEAVGHGENSVGRFFGLLEDDDFEAQIADLQAELEAAAAAGGDDVAALQAELEALQDQTKALEQGTRNVVKLVCKFGIRGGRTG